MSLPHGPQAEVSSEPAVYNWTRSVLDCAEAGLPDFLQRQRWYPAKDAGNPSVTLTALLPFPASAVLAAIAVWQVTPPDRSPMNLFIPVALERRRDADPAQVIAPHLPDTGDVDEEMQTGGRREAACSVRKRLTSSSGWVPLSSLRITFRIALSPTLIEVFDCSALPR